MSVLQIKGRTTSSHEDFDRFAFSSNSFIFTEAVDQNIDEYSIELILGEGWNDNYSEQNKNLRRIGEGITMRPNDSIVVEVQDEIRVPHNKYGIVLPTGSLFLSRGILIAPAKVEPAFCGKLKLRMFNTTQQKIFLKKGEKLGSIVFFATESTKAHKITYRHSEISSPPISSFEVLKKWLSANKIVWVGWLISICTSSLIVFLLTYSLYYRPVLEKQQAAAPQANQKLQGKAEGEGKK